MTRALQTFVPRWCSENCHVDTRVESCLTMMASLRVDCLVASVDEETKVTLAGSVDKNSYM